jgi:hypothetical protein
MAIVTLESLVTQFDRLVERVEKHNKSLMEALKMGKLSKAYEGAESLKINLTSIPHPLSSPVTYK